MMCNPSRNEPKRDVSKTETSAPVTLRNLVYRKAWDQIEKACQCSPADVADKLGDLPLHEACLQAAPFHVIKNLISAYPDGVKKRGFCDRLPLHYAAYNKPSLNIIKLLLKYHPEGAAAVDSDGRMPVHLAVIRNAPKEAILLLISAYPKSLHTANNFGSTPQMLARNEHIQVMLQEEEIRPRNIARNIESMKKFKMAWSASGGIVSKNESKSRKRPHTTGTMVDGQKILKSSNSSRKALNSYNSSASLMTKNSSKRPIFERSGGKYIPPPKGVIFETIRLSIPTPPSTPPSTPYGPL